MNQYKKLLSLGALSLAVQTSSLRELLVALNGNEILIGVFYSSWLLAVVLGAKLSLSIKRNFTNSLTFLYPLIGIITFIAFSHCRSIVGANSWEEIDLIKSIVFIFISNLPFGILGGALFVKFINRAKELDRFNALSYGYTAESIGSVLCGIAFTILLLSNISSIYILFLVTVLFYILNDFYKNNFTAIVSIICFIALSSLFISFKKNNFDFEIETPSQKLALETQHNSLILYSNAQVISSYPNRYNADALSALLMSQSKVLATKVLVTGIGQEELIKSLSHYNTEIYYHIEDKSYIKHIYPKLKEKIKLKEQNINLISEDLRKFLNSKTDFFDIIMVNHGGPSVLSNNKYYSNDFFMHAHKSLKTDGIIAVPLEQEINFLDDELALYGSSILMTLDNNFDYSTIIPGKINYFFAAKNKNNLSTNVHELTKRYDNIKPSDSLYKSESFHSLLDKRRIKLLNEIYRIPKILGPKELINYDKQPSSYLLNNIVTMRKNNIQSASLISKLRINSHKLVLYILLILILFRIIFISQTKATPDKALQSHALIFQALSGFTSLSCYLILLYFFQTKFSQLYSYLGLITASYMFGLCLGAISINKVKLKFSITRIYFTILSLQIALIFLLLLVISLPASFITSSFFIIALIASGFLGGTSYPTAESLINKSSDTTTKYLEEYDYFGGCISGVATTLFFLPFLGVKAFVIYLSICWIALGGMYLITHKIKNSNLNKAKDNLSWIMLTLIVIITTITHTLGASDNNIKPEAKLTAPLSTIETKNIKDSQKIIGYGGPLNLSIQINSSNKISSIELKENNETPYYVQNITTYLNKFIGRNICHSDQLIEVDTLSGATVTSNAILENLINVSSQYDSCQLISKAPAPKKTVRQIIHQNKSLIALLLFLLISIVLKPFIRRPIYRTIYLALLVIALGTVFQIQYSTANIINIFKPGIFAPNLSIAVILITILLGRHYCAYLCPFGALSELISKLSKYRINFACNKAANIKYLLLSMVLISTIVFKINYYHEPLTVFFSGLQNTIFYISVTLLLISILIPRFWCRFLCPCGAFITALSNLSFRLDRLIDFSKYFCSLKTKRYCFKTLNYGNRIIPFVLIAIICGMLILFNVKSWEPLTPKLESIKENIKFISTKTEGSTDKDTQAKATNLKATPGLKNAPIVGIKFIIEKGKLSDHEAMYYEKIDSTR